MEFQETILFQILALIKVLKTHKMLLLLQRKEWVKSSMLISVKKQTQKIQEVIQFQILVLIEISNGPKKVLELQKDN